MIFIVFDIQMYIFLSTDLRLIKICFVFKIIIKAKEMGGGGGGGEFRRHCQVGVSNG